MGGVNSSSPEWFGPADARALDDFWKVYGEAFDEITVETTKQAEGHPEFGPLIRSMTPEQVAAQNEISRAMLVRAFEGNWADYEKFLRAQGAMFANIGISFSGWYDIVRAFHRFLKPKLVAAYSSDPDRLVGALLVGQEFVDRAMRAVGEAYLDAKQAIIQQTEAASAAIRARSDEIQALNRSVEEANRLKSEFLANMSHELRTPLNAIIGFTELLHNGEVEPTSPEHDEFLSDILRSSQHLLRLINDVLDLAKIEAGRLEFFPEHIRLEQPVNEVLAILRTTAGVRNIRRVVEIDPDVGSIYIDPARLKQILYNYLSNALKFSKEGGAVTLRARVEGPDAFRIEVEDTGDGISAEDVPRLFAEFQQVGGAAHKRQGGTGLGLALTKRLVEAQRGSVGVRSTPGKGSTFYAVLPRLGTGRAVPDPIKVPSVAPGARRILVVEDDSRDQNLIVQVLKRAGYAIETASTGAQALARCRESRFDAITLDLLLPDMNGLDVLRGLRTEGKSTGAKVAVVTVVAEREAVAGFAVDDILPKPIEEKSLLNALRRAGVGPERADHVLVVDDDAPSLRLMQTTLSQQGYSVASASDGEAALAAAEARRPAAIVLDLLMPGVDGFEFLARFRANPANARVPVIVWTVKDLTSDETARLRNSAQRIVQKGRDGSVTLIEELRRLFSSPRRHSSGATRAVKG